MRREEWARGVVRSAERRRNARGVGPTARQPPLAVTSVPRTREFGPAGRQLFAREAIVRPRRPLFPRGETEGEGRGRRDARRPGRRALGFLRLRAQLAFKNSMVHGILQFTPSIAFRYVLHRCESRDIRCRESFSFRKRLGRRRYGPRTGPRRRVSFGFLGAVCAGVRYGPGDERGATRGAPSRHPGPAGHGRPAEADLAAPHRRHQFAGRSGQVSTMILPQVHLRKPCYDFSFL
jgi:hypothetical protein